MLVDRKKESLIPFIERKAGLKFERIGAPQPQDVARIAATRAVEAIRVRGLGCCTGRAAPWVFKT